MNTEQVDGERDQDGWVGNVKGGGRGRGQRQEQVRAEEEKMRIRT